jgi:LmbE family N-acetylglucosaminyl deacetylase
MKVLAVGAHPDDIELGAGASLAKHVAMGDEVSFLVMTRGAEREGYPLDKIREQALAAAEILGADVRILGYEDQSLDTLPLTLIAKHIEYEIGQVAAERVYTHSAGDLNLDHQITARAVAVASRPLPGCTVCSVHAFEVPSSSEWGTGFRPTLFRDVHGWPMQKKLDALECYVGEMRKFPHPRSREGIMALATLRGAQVGVNMAEAFEVIREIR